MSVVVRLRDAIAKYVPEWLSDRVGQSVGYRFLWSISGAPLDVMLDFALQGIQAAWPGRGTPTALPMIGRSRRIFRGQADTDDDYAAVLRAWLEVHARERTEQLARDINRYLSNHPRVRVVDRSGNWVTVDTDGTVTRTRAAWNWDGTSNPERAGYWSDMWIIVYPTQYAFRSGTVGTMPYDAVYGTGLMIPRDDLEVLRGIIADVKGAHTFIRCVIWTTDATLFDPTNPSSLPNGNWGKWGQTVAGSYVPSDRNTASCRYWEPN